MTPKITPAKDVGIDDGGVGLVEPGTAEALAGQRRVDDNCGGGAATEEGGRVGGAGEFGGSTMPVVSTPRHPLNVPIGVSTPGGSGVSARTPRAGTEREELRRRREATAKQDAEMEVALWIEGVSGVTFPGRFWSSLKDGGEEAIICCVDIVENFRICEKGVVASTYSYEWRHQLRTLITCGVGVSYKYEVRFCACVPSFWC